MPLLPSSDDEASKAGILLEWFGTDRPDPDQISQSRWDSLWVFGIDRDWVTDRATRGPIDGSTKEAIEDSTTSLLPSTNHDPGVLCDFFQPIDDVEYEVDMDSTPCSLAVQEVQDQDCEMHDTPCEPTGTDTDMSLASVKHTVVVVDEDLSPTELKRRCTAAMKERAAFNDTVRKLRERRVSGFEPALVRVMEELERRALENEDVKKHPDLANPKAIRYNIPGFAGGMVAKDWLSLEPRVNYADDSADAWLSDDVISHQINLEAGSFHTTDHYFMDLAEADVWLSDSLPIDDRIRQLRAAHESLDEGQLQPYPGNKVRSWPAAVLATTTKVVFPLCKSSHWIAVAISYYPGGAAGIIEYFDSLSGSHGLSSHYTTLLRLLAQLIWRHPALRPATPPEWIFLRGPSTIQPNSHDCGIICGDNCIHLLRADQPVIVIGSTAVTAHCTLLRRRLFYRLYELFMGHSADICPPASSQQRTSSIVATPKTPTSLGKRKSSGSRNVSTKVLTKASTTITPPTTEAKPAKDTKYSVGVEAVGVCNPTNAKETHMMGPTLLTENYRELTYSNHCSPGDEACVTPSADQGLWTPPDGLDQSRRRGPMLSTNDLAESDDDDDGGLLSRVVSDVSDHSGRLQAGTRELLCNALTEHGPQTLSALQSRISTQGSNVNGNIRDCLERSTSMFSSVYTGTDRLFDINTDGRARSVDTQSLHEMFNYTPLTGEEGLCIPGTAAPDYKIIVVVIRDSSGGLTVGRLRQRARELLAVFWTRYGMGEPQIAPHHDIDEPERRFWFPYILNRHSSRRSLFHTRTALPLIGRLNCANERANAGVKKSRILLLGNGFDGFCTNNDKWATDFEHRWPHLEFDVTLALNPRYIWRSSLGRYPGHFDNCTYITWAHYQLCTLSHLWRHPTPGALTAVQRHHEQFLLTCHLIDCFKLDLSLWHQYGSEVSKSTVMEEHVLAYRFSGPYCRRNTFPLREILQANGADSIQRTPQTSLAPGLDMERLGPKRPRWSDEELHTLRQLDYAGSTVESMLETINSRHGHRRSIEATRKRLQNLKKEDAEAKLWE